MHYRRGQRMLVDTLVMPKITYLQQRLRDARRKLIERIRVSNLGDEALKRFSNARVDHNVCEFVIAQQHAICNINTYYS